VLSSREALLAHLRSRLSFFSILYLSFCDVVKNIQRIELGTNLSRIIVCVLRHWNWDVWLPILNNHSWYEKVVSISRALMKLSCSVWDYLPSGIGF
jgi:hypothetical protein